MKIANIEAVAGHATTATESAKTPRANSTLFQKKNRIRNRTMQQLLSLFLILLSFTQAQAQWADFKVNVRANAVNYIGVPREVCNSVIVDIFTGARACTETSNYGWRSNISWNENGGNISTIRSEDSSGNPYNFDSWVACFGGSNGIIVCEGEIPILLGNAVNDEAQHTGDAHIFLSNPIQKNSQYSIFPFFFFEDDGTYNSSLAYIDIADAAAQGSYKIFLTQKPPTANTNFVEVIDELNTCTDGSCNDWYNTLFSVAWNYVPPTNNSQILQPSCYSGVINQSYNANTLTASCFPSWAVSLEGGRNYKFYTLGSSFNTLLRLYDTNGYSVSAVSNINPTDVATNTQRGEITFSVPASGIYYLELATIDPSLTNARVPISPSSGTFQISIQFLDPIISFPERNYCSSTEVLSPNDSASYALENYNNGCAAYMSLDSTEELYNFPKRVTRIYNLQDFNGVPYSGINESYMLANVSELLDGGIIQNSDGTLSTAGWMNYVSNLPAADYDNQMAINAQHYQYYWYDHTNFDDIIYTGPILTIPPGSEHHQFYLKVFCDLNNGACDSQTPLWSKPVVPATITACDAYTWPTNGQTYTTTGTYTSSDKVSFFRGANASTAALAAAGYSATPTESFESYPLGSLGTTFGNNFGAGLPTWTATATGGLFTVNAYYGGKVLSTNEFAPMTISFSSGVTSLTGEFFETDVATNEVIPSTISFTLSNGSIQSYSTNSSDINFVSFVSHDAYISSITISPSSGRVNLDNLVASTGTITPCVNCVNAALALTITPSTTNTTTLSACGSYTWPVNGQTYTQGGSYSAVNGCDTQILALTVNSNVTPAPTGNATQTFVTGNTIANIVVAGSNLIWYATNNDALAQTNPLAPTTVLVNGATYYVTQTLAGCPSAPLAVLVTASLGADSFDSLPFSYAPNPTSGVLTISYSKAISQIDVVNLVGQTVLHQSANASEVQVDLSSLANATYFVKVVAEGKTKTFKVVKD